MMKIGLLTFHYSMNYGSVMQCLALQTILESMGHDVEFIKYKQSDMVYDDIDAYIDNMCDKARFTDDLLNRDYSYTKDELNYMLKDRIGFEFPIYTDRINCNNLIYNSKITSISNTLPFSSRKTMQ